jgi:hypothetical protein
MAEHGDLWLIKIKTCGFMADLWLIYGDLWLIYRTITIRKLKSNLQKCGKASGKSRLKPQD